VIICALYNVFLRKDVPYRGFVDMTAQKKNPKGAVFASQFCKMYKLAYYHNCCINSNQILHNNKGQILFMCGPNMHTTNARYWHGDAHWCLESNWLLKF